MNKIGVMQGRLLPKYKGQYQAHPKNYWDKEFYLAASMGLNLIEFIVDLEDINENPLMSENGVNTIKRIQNSTGVFVETICADCFMALPLHDKDLLKAVNSLNYLKDLIAYAGKLQISNIVIPCVDQAALKSDEDFSRFRDVVGSVLELASKYQINLSLETDLNPEKFARLIDDFKSEVITVNYDIGNSASMGYNPREELLAYGSRISDIHIKDRIKGRGSVLLGSGDADFDLFFEELIRFKYKGPFIMQAYRDDEGVEIFKKQLNWIEPYLRSYSESIAE
jgi:L-ribulose-5-phosphate 3-epimerase UlaE